GAVTITNPPNFTTVNVDDSADPTFRTVTQSTSSFADGPYGRVDFNGGPTIYYKYADTSNFTLHTGTAGATVNVRANGGPPTLVGHGLDTTVNVANAGSLANILPAIDVSNPPSYTALTVDTSAFEGTYTAALSDSAISFDGGVPISYAF